MFYNPKFALVLEIKHLQPPKEDYLDKGQNGSILYSFQTAFFSEVSP